MSDKKITKVTEPVSQQKTTFVASAENKGKAKQLRLFALLAWAVAIGAEVFAIVLLRQPPVNMVWLVGLIVLALVLAITGSMLWKKANRLDPASEKDKLRFFIQNQLGFIISVIAFLPLVILILTNKDLNGKQKGILGTVAIVALVAASIGGYDFAPPSQEQYTAQIQEVEALSGQDHVYWTKSGTKYHLYDDCQHINTDKTSEIFQGSVAQARELKNITELCKTCKARIVKEKGLDEPESQSEAQ